MTRDSNDWWSLTLDSAGPGTNYGFVLDGEGPLPDPRSLWQPSGVHGLSRVVDHTEFPWTDHQFRPTALASAVVYELHIGTFTSEGTFDSAVGRLDYLAELGVSHVEIMPVNAFPGQHGWGYDGVDLFSVHQAYGGPAALKHLINACHMRGLAVILDVVYNHLGPSGNYLARFAPYFNQRYFTPWGPAVNFDSTLSDEVRRFFCDNAIMWLRDYHVDGLRLDAVHAILDTSAEPFLEQLSNEVTALEEVTGRHYVLIAESDLNDPRLLWSRERGGFDLDAQWNDDFHHALHCSVTGEKTGYYSDYSGYADLAKAFRHAYVYDGCYSPYRRRRHGRSPRGLSGHRFIVFTQNHDQIGNRLRGDRLSHNLDPGRLKIAAALLLTSPFVPMLFMGEEWGASTPFLYFTDHQEPEMARAIREGRCREFSALGWKAEDVPDPQAVSTFEQSKLNWSEQNREPHADLLEWYRRLLQLRRGEPALLDGRLDWIETHYDEVNRWFALERGPVSVVCNLNHSDQRIPIRPGAHEVLLASAPAGLATDSRLDLSAASVAILQKT